MIRLDHPDAVYKNQKGKFMATVNRVKELHTKGQPVLIGTISIEKSEMLSKLLQMSGVPHTVLNAKFHEKEAEIVAKAGQKGAVTIATNMAGRGTDIKLGEGVRELGGLFILGTERHESRRIDNQLRGRSGRQGDPGASQFCVSMDDELMRLFGAERVQKMMEFMKLPEDMPIENRMISNSIESAQKKVEGRNFEIRKHLVEYDDVMNKQREIIYSRRRRMLFSADIKNDILLLIEKEAEAIVLNHTGARSRDEWDFMKIRDAVNALHKDQKTPFDIGKMEKLDDPEEMIDLLKHYLWDEYGHREKSLADYKETAGSENLRQLERAVYLRTLDMLWMEQIDNMSHLREAVSLRGYSQRDPLIEYKQEAFQMFSELLANIRTNTVNTLFKIEFRQQVQIPGLSKKQPVHMVTNEDQIEHVLGGERDMGKELSENPVVVKAGGAPLTREPVVGRNDPCPCGSKKKYKKCHGA
jgi:preprotein translocase subunit SecA